MLSLRTSPLIWCGDRRECLWCNPFPRHPLGCHHSNGTINYNSQHQLRRCQQDDARQAEEACHGGGDGVDGKQDPRKAGDPVE